MHRAVFRHRHRPLFLLVVKEPADRVSALRDLALVSEGRKMVHVLPAFRRLPEPSGEPHIFDPDRIDRPCTEELISGYRNRAVPAGGPACPLWGQFCLTIPPARAAGLSSTGMGATVCSVPKGLPAQFFTEASLRRI